MQQTGGFEKNGILLIRGNGLQHTQIDGNSIAQKGSTLYTVASPLIPDMSFLYDFRH